MASTPLLTHWLRRHRDSAQGLERLWRPTASTRLQKPAKRRRWTLLAITICLHVLLWSSVIPLVTMLALFAARSIDTTILPSTVLTIVSVSVSSRHFTAAVCADCVQAIASISYVVLHSINARRQTRLQLEVKPRKYQNACYVAIRLAVTLCILWLMTSGWNFIIAARQPVCLPASSVGEDWEVGGSCVAERFSAAISFVAL